MMADPQGYLPLARRMFDGHDPLWEGREPFDRRSAWIDLCQMAQYQPRERMVQGELISLGRGQLLASERYLAERWHWTRAKVHRFLVLLASEKVSRIVTKSNHVASIITLLNYDTYNVVATGDRTTNSTTDGPATNHRRTKEEEREEREEGKEVPRSEQPSAPTHTAKSSRKKLSTPLPDEWAPNERHAAIADERSLDLDTEAEKFRDWAAAKDERKSDWDAAFRNWLRNARPVYGGSSAAPGWSGAGGGIIEEGMEDRQRKQAERKAAEEAAVQAREAEYGSWSRRVATEFAKLPEAEREAWKDAARPAVAHLKGQPAWYDVALKAEVFRRYGAEIGILEPERRTA